MKHLHLFVLSLILPASIFGQGIQTHTLIDFNTFEESIQQTYPNPENQLISVNGEAVAELGSELFALDNWLVALTNSSGENPISRRDSYTKNVNSTEQGTVLGVRVKFPDWRYAGEANVSPIFPILPFNKEGQYVNINNGVVTNVGTVKSFSMWANGRNFKFTVGVRVVDIKGKLTEFGLGSLFYIGWRKLVYSNPFFSDKPINNIKPNARMYPSEIPIMQFDKIAIYKPHNCEGGNFVGYFGNMEIEYSPYITVFPTDIDDEATWGIIKTEQEKLASNINGVLYETILQYEYAKQRVINPTEANNADNAANNNAAGDANNANDPAAANPAQ